MVIAGIRFVLVLGILNAVMPHIDFEAWEYAPNSRKTEALVILPFKRIGKFTKCKFVTPSDFFRCQIPEREKI